MVSRCGFRSVSRQAGKSSLRRECVSGSVAVEKNGRDELVGRAGRLCLLSVEKPVRFKEGRTLCTVGALYVGVDLPWVAGRV